MDNIATKLRDAWTWLKDHPNAQWALGGLILGAVLMRLVR